MLRWAWVVAVGLLLMAVLGVTYVRERQKAEIMLLESARAHALLVENKLDDLDSYLSETVEAYLKNPDQNYEKTRDRLLFGRRVHPSVMDFIILNPAGRAAVWTREGPLPDISDREYWLAHQAQNAETVCVTRPLISRADREKRWFVALSRGFRDAEGRLQAVGVVNIDARELGKEIAALLVNDSDRTGALVHESGELIYRIPFVSDITPGAKLPLLEGKTFPLNTPFVGLIEHSLDHKTRLGAAQSIERYCLAVTSTLDFDQIMAPWRFWSVWGTLFGLALAAGGFGVLRKMGRLSREKSRSEGIYRALFDHVADPIFLLEPSGDRFVFSAANGAYFKRQNRPEGSPLGKPEPHECHRFAHCAKSRKPLVYEEEIGGISWMTVLSPVLDVDGRVVLLVGVSRDITAHVNQEALLRDFNEKLAHQVEHEVAQRLAAQKERDLDRQLLIQQSKMAEMGSMIGVIAHQWKQPLNVIALLIQSVYDDYEAGEITPELLAKSVERIMDQVRFMSQTVDDFRSFYKPGKTKELFSAKAAIEKTLELLSAQIKKHEIEVITDMAEAGEVTGFPSEFKQVILNLITNAKDVLCERAEKRQIRIRIQASADRVAIILCDNGGGIPEAYLPDKLFEPFVSSKGEAGTGVGLLLAKTIIEKKMGGTIKAYNEGGGACFEIDLPRAKTQS